MENNENEEKIILLKKYVVNDLEKAQMSITMALYYLNLVEKGQNDLKSKNLNKTIKMKDVLKEFSEEIDKIMLKEGRVV